MGKIRARTDEELAARKQEILSAARDLLMTMSYESITLAAIAEKTSISHRLVKSRLLRAGQGLSA